MIVILLTCKKLQSTKNHKLSYYALGSFFFSVTPRLNLQCPPLYLGNPFPLNNITYFTKKENSQDVGLQNNVVSRFAKGRTPLGI